MQSAKKRSTQILSALSMAAASAVAAHTAHGATLNMYYGQETSYANSNNGVFVSTGYKPQASGQATDAVGEDENLTGVTPVAASNVVPTTIMLPVGSYLSLALDAVLTGNANPYAGQAFKGQHQPAFMGLSELGIAISSSDATGVLLTPVASSSSPDTTINGLPSYHSSAFVNQTFNAGASATPTWLSVEGAGEVQPNLPGFDSSPNSSGGVGFPSPSTGASAFTAGGNTGPIVGNTPTGIGIAGQFAAQANVASYAVSTDFADSITFDALKTGLVTLAPFAVSTSTEYWSAAAGQTAATNYTATHVSGTDVINNVPVIVVDITGGSSSIPIVSFTATGPASGYGAQITNGTGANQGAFSPVGNALTVTSTGTGHYTPASVTNIQNGSGTGVTLDSVEATGFVSGDEEVYAVDVLVNGTQATSGQLATLIAAIGGTGVPASSAVTATTQSPVPNPFGSQYNLFLDPHDIGGGTDWLGLDLQGSNDAALAGYSFSAVAVVPEPMTLGLLALGGVGLMTRRHRRKA